MTDSTAPEFNGECAFALSLGKSGVIGSPNHQLEENGHVYQFKNGVARFLFKTMPNRSEKAAAAWAAR
jgi:hypothetical protein